MRDTPGTVLAGKYELIRVAGVGGMAVVWRAVLRGPRGEQPVALKRMLVHSSAQGFADLFIEEARVGLGLKHDNIVQVLDFSANDTDGYFLVMEWVEGIDLFDFMRAYHADRRHMPWQAVLAVGSGACKGLCGAHERIDAHGRRSPVIHRDITPSNVLVGVNGQVKIADFGLARATDRGSMTTPNTIKGKLGYTAPELTTGQPATVRSDLFSLGVTLWECLAARKLFSGKTNIDIIQAIIHWRIPELQQLRPDLPADVVEAISRAFAREPQQRYESARAMGAALDRLLERDPVGPERLGVTVQAARHRLSQLDAAAALEKEHSLAEADLVSVCDEPVQPPHVLATPAPRPNPPMPGRVLFALRAPADATLPAAPAAPAADRPLARVPRPGRPTPSPSLPDSRDLSITAQMPSLSDTIEVSGSDLFDVRIDSQLDAANSPAVLRMAGREELEHLLEHESSWDVPTPGKQK